LEILTEREFACAPNLLVGIMENEQAKQTQTDEEKRESGMPGGGAGRVDEVGESGVYPVSEMEGASEDATVHGAASFGQGERGAAGYEDSGGSELIYLDEERGVIGGSAPTGESGAYQNVEDIEEAKKLQSEKND
jgi:hypothetical protein